MRFRQTMLLNKTKKGSQMSYKLSTESQKIIEKYIEAGYVINPYSDKWVKAHEGVELINDQSENLICLENLNFLDNEYDQSYRDHLLIFYVESHNEELIKDLSSLDPSIRYIFEEKDGGMHWPNFLFMNLKTGKVFAVGVGRKYSLFGYDVEEYASEKESSINSAELYEIYGTNGVYLEKLKELDYWGLIPNIIQNLELYANSIDEWNDLSQDHDHDEPYTDEMNECLEGIELATSALTLYFPRIDMSDLNPEDY